jgi:hypothetical protein
VPAGGGREHEIAWAGSAASKREQRHERELSERFEAAYRRLVSDWQPKRSGAGATRGAHLEGISKQPGSAAGISPEPAL